MNTSLISRKHITGIPRVGTAIVELAVCLPVLVMMTLATVEACTMLYVQQTLKTTAFEGARVGIVPGATVENINFQCETLLDSHSINGYAISANPSDPTQLSQGDWLEITITAPFADNSLVGGWIYSDKTLERSVSLRAE
ncbi:TadE family protein [Rubripirellula reticaptiva]|uniref:TadE-like protein n=1 Tax=Rubripirellula reticaptiva TaxID=2528013 RepID=A0A5C6EUD2_9BACT|nr:TadE family protein [Rubripirellula reticaptiva]TWU51900.1 TadE-like protein [Rubripirellula reticaptiva]